MSKVQAIPMQQHLGVCSFLVFGPESPLHGQQVNVRVLRREWYEARRSNTNDFSHYDRSMFEANVLNEVGIVHAHGLQVPHDVLQAVWAQVQVYRANASNPGSYVDSLTTGFKSPELGWIRSTVATMSIPVVTYLEEDDPQIAATFATGSFVAESLAARHRAGSVV